jgi:hypothetical protein
MQGLNTNLLFDSKNGCNGIPSPPVLVNAKQFSSRIARQRAMSRNRIARFIGAREHKRNCEQGQGSYGSRLGDFGPDGNNS